MCGSPVADKLRKYFRLRHQAKIFLGRFLILDRGALKSDGDGLYIEDKNATAYYKISAGAYSVNQSHVVSLRWRGSEGAEFAVRLPNAHLVAPFAVALTRRRKIVAEYLYGAKTVMLTLNPFRYVTNSFIPSDATISSAFSLNGPYAHNYYHWMTDVLPSLLIYEAIVKPHDPECILVVPGYLFAWQKRSLELLGYTEKDYLQFCFTHVRVNNLWISRYPKFNEIDLPMRPLYFTWLRTRLMEKMVGDDRNELQTIRKCEYLCISRKGSRKGRIGNEDQIVKKMEELGFKVIVLSEIDLDEQIRCFAEAKIVVAVHGAGLTNLIFSTRPVVIEIMPGAINRRDYYSLTEYTGGQYIQICAKEKDQNGCYVASISLLEETVSKILC